MKTLTKDMIVYAMSRQDPPALRVAAGESFRVQTEDCYSGALRTERDVFTRDKWDRVNPATGPVHVEGARPGDVLRVDIERIDVRDHAVMCVQKGAGAVGDKIEGAQTVILPIVANRLQLRDGLTVAIRPMIGVIGTAPAGEAVPTGTPGEHGGNMDCKEIADGSSLYLPVGVPGALLALGDLHALMGDGEVCGCGAEVSGEVELRAAPLRTNLPTPCVRTPEHWLFIGSAKTLDECEMIVLDKAHRFLTGIVGLSANEAARIMSLVGELRVCQVVDPLKTMKFLLPTAILARFGFAGPR
jgi:amidase